MANFKLNISNIEDVENDLRKLVSNVKESASIRSVSTSSNELGFALSRLGDVLDTLAKNIRLTSGYLSFYLQDIQSFDNSLNYGNILKSGYVPFSIDNYITSVKRYNDFSSGNKMCKTNYLTGTVAWNGKPNDYASYIKGFVSSAKPSYGINGCLSNVINYLSQEAGIVKDNETENVQEDGDNKLNTQKQKEEVTKRQVEYVVKPGDNLSKIARSYGVSVDDLYNENKDIIGPNINLINVGITLSIPGKFEEEKVKKNNDTIKDDVDTTKANTKTPETTKVETTTESLTQKTEKAKETTTKKPESTTKTEETLKEKVETTQETTTKKPESTTKTEETLKEKVETTQETTTKKPESTTKTEETLKEKVETTQETTKVDTTVGVTGSYSKYAGNLHVKSSCKSSNAKTVGVVTTNNQKYTLVSGNSDCNNNTMTKAEYDYIIATMCAEASPYDQYQEPELLAIASCILNRNECTSENFGSTWNKLIYKGYTKYEYGAHEQYMPGGSQYNTAKVAKAKEALNVAMSGVRNVGPEIMYNEGNGSYDNFGDHW